MTDTTLLLTGIFVFSLILVAVGLTIQEFKQLGTERHSLSAGKAKRTSDKA
jgi:hypothetical protein